MTVLLEVTGRSVMVTVAAPLAPTPWLLSDSGVCSARSRASAASSMAVVDVVDDCFLMASDGDQLAN